MKTTSIILTRPEDSSMSGGEMPLFIRLDWGYLRIKAKFIGKNIFIASFYWFFTNPLMLGSEILDITISHSWTVQIPRNAGNVSLANSIAESRFSNSKIADQIGSNMLERIELPLGSYCIAVHYCMLPEPPWMPLIYPSLFPLTWCSDTSRDPFYYCSTKGTLAALQKTRSINVWHACGVLRKPFSL